MPKAFSTSVILGITKEYVPYVVALILLIDSPKTSQWQSERRWSDRDIHVV